MSRLALLQELMGRMQRFGPVLPRELDGAYTAYNRRRTHPRYYMSPSYLAHDHSYLWGEFYGCWVVLKRRWTHNPVLYAVLPPMSPIMDEAAELRCMAGLLELGIGVKLSAEDMAAWGGFTAAAVPQAGNTEYVYDMQAAMRLAGPSYAHLRLAANQAKRLHDVGELVSEHITGPVRLHSPHGASDVMRLARQWVASRHRFSGQVQQADVALSGHASATLVYAGKLAAYRLSECVAPGWYVGAAHAWQPTDTYKYASHYAHLADIEGWVARVGVDGDPMYYNFGSAVGDPGLARHKEALAPCTALQIYDLKPSQPVTAEEWKQAPPATVSAPLQQMLI